MAAQPPTEAPAAAAAADATATPLPLPVGDAGKLTVIHKTEYFQEAQDFYRQVTEEYAASQGLELEISTANPSAFGDFMAKMSAAVQAGNPPDASYVDLNVAQMRFLDIVEDVSAVVDQAVVDYGDVVPLSAAREAKLEGTWWAIPYRCNTNAYYIRKSWAEPAGVDWDALKFYDDYRSAALAISNAAEERWGWGLTYLASDGQGLIMDCIQAHGGSITEESGQIVNFNSPATLEAVNWLVESYTADEWAPMLPPGVHSWTDSSNNEAYLAGKIGLTKNSYSLYGNMKRDTPDIYEDTAVLNRPHTKNGDLLETGGAAWLVVFKGAKNIEAAMEYCSYMLQPEAFNPMVQIGAGLFLPCYKDLYTDEVLAYDPNIPKLRDIMFNPTEYKGFSHPAESTALHASIGSASILQTMISKAVSGEMTPEEALQDAHERIVLIWEEGGIPQA